MTPAFERPSLRLPNGEVMEAMQASGPYMHRKYDYPFLPFESSRAGP